MADPARYIVEPLLSDGNKHPDPEKVTLKAELYIERSPYGKWVKWSDFEDYKAAQRRNQNADAVNRLGMEVVALRTRLQDMEKAGNRLAKAAKRLAKTDYEDGEGISGLLKDWEEAKTA